MIAVVRKGLQEIGDPAGLDDFIAGLDRDWPGITLDRPDSRGIRVAWLTRHPIGALTEIVEFPAPLSPVQVNDEGTTLGTTGRGSWPLRSPPTQALRCG